MIHQLSNIKSFISEIPDNLRFKSYARNRNLTCIDIGKEQTLFSSNIFYRPVSFENQLDILILMINLLSTLFTFEKKESWAIENWSVLPRKALGHQTYIN